MTGRERAQLERLTAALEACDARRSGWCWREAGRNLLYGMCRGLGFTLGFSGLGALLAMLLRGLVADNIPLIGGFLAEVIRAIEARM